jgi:hypothetical protein
MSMQLTKLIYGGQTDPKKTPFGILSDQTKFDSICNNGGWFNLAGDKIGSGDLSIKDMAKIAKHIPENEMFLVLTEYDTNWGMPSDFNSTSPGRDYVFQKVAWIIAAKGAIIKVKDATKAPTPEEKEGVKYTCVPRADLYAALKYVPVKLKEAKGKPIKKDTGVQRNAIYPHPASPPPAAVKSNPANATSPVKTSTLKSGVKKSGGYLTPAIPGITKKKKASP